MNKQDGANRIEWTDYTWNPVRGCQHGCAWQMPDGSRAECYAKTIAEGVARGAYPYGFDLHQWMPDALAEPLKLKAPARIFLDSMSDLMGHWVEEWQVEAVLKVCDHAHWHTFQLLTKNAPRLERFTFAPNVWVGVSAPPSEWAGRALTIDQQLRMVYRQMAALTVAKRNGAKVTWMSIEPLSFDIADHINPDVLDWVVIGAASNGRRVYQPEPQWVENVLRRMDGKPVFFKGNLRSNPAAEPWREEFPVVERLTQGALF